ncbi:MAG TPA: site-specific integrase [Tissierellia bacterium]|nr:site-specific integrase [Tissierellia bacterium]
MRTSKIFDRDGNYHYELKVTKPKTKASRREVPLPAALKPELKKLEILVAEEKLKLGEAYTNNTLLFPSQTGTYIDAKNLQRSWKRALEKANLPYRKFHALRHTYATTLFEKGVNIVTVSKLLGHSTIKTTEIYTHVLEDVKKEEVQVLNEFFA